MNSDSLITGSRESGSKRAAEALLREISVAALERPGEPVAVAWCGGTSPKQLCQSFLVGFGELTAEVQKCVHFVFVDERRVPLDDPESNYRMLSTELLNPLLEQQLISESQIHPFPVEQEPLAAAGRYTGVIASLGGIQIVILGVGPDGHVAALFPSHPALGVNEARYLYINDRPKPPSEGFTASVPLLRSCGVAVLLFFGEEKRDAFERYVANRPMDRTPAVLARSIPTRYLVTDIADAEERVATLTRHQRSE